MTWQLWNEDCIANMALRLGPNSVDHTTTSIPFGALFMYSGKPEDVGNNQDGNWQQSTDMVASMFGIHLRMWAEQMAIVHKPGTNLCIHIQQLLTYKIQHGFMGRRDFRGAVIDVLSAAGWNYTGEFAISKNPQAIAQRMKLHSLLFVTGARDARQLAPAVNDFVLIFQLPGEAAPVAALIHSSNPDGWLTSEEWIRDAHGVWTDIRETDVLEGWQGAREEGDEKHVCPLQLEVIRRCVKLYSNPGEVVFDPFMGIGSTGFVAIEQGRQTAGFELKESYYRQAARNLERAVEVASQKPQTLLSLLDEMDTERHPDECKCQRVCGGDQ